MASSDPVSPRVRKPQARGRATRARLLEAARDLFTRQGYEGSSIGDVALAAGVGVGTVYHHFPDKRALLLALLDEWRERVFAEASDPSGNDAQLVAFFGDRPAAAIHGWLTESYDRLRKRPSIYLATLAMAARDEEVAARYRRVEEHAIRRLREIIRVGQERGFMRSELDRAAAAFLVHHAIDVTATQVLVRGAPEDGSPEAAAVVKGLSEMICRYLLVPAVLDAHEARDRT